jgi:hypothetical protein
MIDVLLCDYSNIASAFLKNRVPRKQEFTQAVTENLLYGHLQCVVCLTFKSIEISGGGLLPNHAHGAPSQVVVL